MYAFVHEYLVNGSHASVVSVLGISRTKEQGWRITGGTGFLINWILHQINLYSNKVKIVAG